MPMFSARIAPLVTVIARRALYTAMLASLAPALAPTAAHAGPAHTGPSSDYNTTCSTQGITEGADGTANNLICNGSLTWQYPSYIIGSLGAGGTAMTCSSTTAGAVQWTGTYLQYCNGTAWQTILNSGSGSGIYLGASASATNPQNSSNAGTGLYSASTSEVDVAENGTQVAAFNSSGINIGTGSLLIGGQNGLSFPPDYTTGASIAIGSGALKYQAIGTTTQGNTAIGYQALAATALGTSAYQDTAIGLNALSSNTTASYNTAVGGAALRAATSGGSNAAFGQAALIVNTTGLLNTGLGTRALQAVTTGSHNTGVGGWAGAAVTTGAANTILGSGVAATTLQTGSNNILIGTGSSVDTPTSSTSNYLNIGNTIFGTNIGTVGVGSVGIGTTTPVNKLDVYGGVAIGSASGYAGSTVAPTNGMIVAGSVGIGTTSPTTALQVQGTVQAGSGNAQNQTFIGTGNGASALGYATGYLGFNSIRSSSAWTIATDGAHDGGVATWGNINGDFYFATVPNAGTPTANQTLTDAQMMADVRMTIDNSGRVGIGTTAPQSTLHVVGGQIFFANSTSYGYGQLYNDGWAHLAADNTSGQVLVLSAPLGIYIRPTVNGTTTALLSTNGGNSYINGTGGDVGIGTTSPGQALTVSTGATGGAPTAGTSGFQVDASSLGTTAGNDINFGGFFASCGNACYLHAHLRQIGTSSTWNNAAFGLSYDVDGTVGAGGSLWFYNGKIGIGSTAPVVSLDLSQKTDALALPNGASSTRPTGTALANGEIRYNSGTSAVEYWNGTTWVSLENSGASSGLYLGASATTPNPAASASDTTTGLYTSGTGHVDITSQGTQVADWSSTGLGVGTASALDALTVAKADSTAYVSISTTKAQPWTTGSGAVGQIYNTSATDSSASYLDLAATNAAGDKQRAYIGAVSTTGSGVYSPAMTFGVQTGSSAYNEYMRIGSNGSVVMGSSATGVGAFLYNPTAPLTGCSTPNSTNNYCNNAFIGVYDVSNATYYGVSAQLPAPAGVAAMGGYYNGLGIGGTTNNAGNPIFGVLTSTQNQNGVGHTALTVYDTNKITTYNSVLDNGSGLVGIGTKTPVNNLDVYGGVAIGSASGYAGSTVAPTNGMIVAGSVGIGTTSPAYSLDLYGNMAVRSGNALALFNSTNNINGTLSFDGTQINITRPISLDAGSIVPIIYARQESAGPVAVFTNGNVGIGTTSPSYSLDVWSGYWSSTGLRIANDSTGGIPWLLETMGQSATGQVGNFEISRTDTNAIPLVIQPNGNVGIGSTAPVVSLDLSQKTDALALPNGASSTRPTGTALANGEIRYNSGTSAVEYWNGTTWVSLENSGASSGLYLGASATTPNPAASASDTTTGLYTSGTGHVDITSQGTQVADWSSTGLGIGTASALDALTVAKADSTAYVSISTTKAQPWTTGSGAVGQIYNTSATDSSASYLDLAATNASGNKQRAYIGAVSTTGTGVYSPAMTFGIQTGSSAYNEYMRIGSNGYVGIGTTSPSTLFQVNIGSTQNVLFGTTATSQGAFYDNPSVYSTGATSVHAGAFGIYDKTNGFYYGISAALPSPPGWSTIGGYYQGLGVSGATSGVGNPIFGVLASTQSTNGLGNVAFTIYDTNKIVTYNNTLDNGSGQAYFAGNVGIGTTAPGKILQVNSSTQYQGVRVSNGTNNVADVVGSSTTNDNGEVVLYSSGSQNAVLAASGSSYFNGGNVGIGTSTPAVKMDIIGGAEHVGGRVGAESTLATAVLPSQGTYIGWNENNGYGVSDFMNDPGSGGGGFEFSLFNSSGVFVSTPMVIKSSGNIGIGTTSPGAALDVASGSIRVMSSNTPTSGTGLELYYDGVYGKVLAYNRSSSVYRYLDLNDTMYVTGSSGGSVGIGTTSPSSLLEVNGGSTTGTELKIDSSSVQAGPHLTISSTGSGGHTWQIISDQAGNSSGAGPLEFYDATAGATRMVINTSGSIGIGTTSPSALLDLTSSQTGYNGGIYFRNTASGQNFAISSRDNSAPARFSISDETNHLERFVINASGSVGIGSTAPVVSLDLSQKTDAIALPNGASSTRPTGTALANGEIRYNSGTSAVEYWNGTTWISLTGGGASGGTANYVARWTGTSSLGIGALYDNGTQVSIGNTAPAAALDVTGAIYSRSNNAGSATTINWATSNEQYTTASCGAFSFSGMQDGGSYTLLVEGTTSGTCSFSNSDSPTLAFRLPSNHGATTSGTMTLYHFLRMGTYVIVTWMPGYSP